MLAVKGLYDGKNIKFFEKVRVRLPHEVIVTFIDTDENKELQEGIYQLAETSGSFNFLNDSGEDIYSDADLKVRYGND